LDYILKIWIRTLTILAFAKSAPVSHCFVNRKTRTNVGYLHQRCYNRWPGAPDKKKVISTFTTAKGSSPWERTVTAVIEDHLHEIFPEEMILSETCCSTT
jgi:hypothetical protein